jgi:hypothetical protein
MKRMQFLGAMGATAVAAVLACAQQPAQGQEPPRNVSAQRHGNIAAAQDLSRRAYDKLTAAQQANEFDLGGHAARAKQLLLEASEEMRLAATAANRH